MMQISLSSVTALNHSSRHEGLHVSRVPPAEYAPMASTLQNSMVPHCHPQAPWYECTTIYKGASVLVQQLMGWPMYLFLNTSGV